MKKLIALSFFLAILNIVSAQVKDPVAWAYASKKINETTYEVSLTATLQRGWHLYSQTTPEGGPPPTAFAFAKNPLLALVGSLKEVGKLEEKFEPLFDVNVKQFSNSVVFVQQVKVKGKAKTSLNGSVTFMTCNNQECMPPQTKKFSVALK